MKLRLESDNWDYGTVGEKVIINNTPFIVGDIYSIKFRNYNNKIINGECMVVNKQDEYSEKRIPMFMGIGELWGNEKIDKCVKKYQDLKIGDEIKGIVICFD